MSLIGYEYVSNGCNGNLESCDKSREEIAGHVRELYHNSKKIGYLGITICDRQNLDDEGLDDGDIDSLMGIVNGIFPFLYVLLSYDPNSVGEDEILAIEKRFDLKRTRQC
ncbi:hypothetical protein KY332_03120 [Candidatus Woesearchaeota archaeon]|nr:hypothetical protein [Candidatus Woesearchaeota archaeon]